MRNRSFPTTLRNGHNSKKCSNPYKKLAIHYAHGASRYYNVPTGANISWSRATIFIAGPNPLLFVIGNALLKNLNHLNWTGAIIKPYAINLVKRSKSKGGGKNFESGISSFVLAGFFLSSSWISMATVSSLVIPPGLRRAVRRMVVMDWATVSAIPPRTALVIIIVRTARCVKLCPLVKCQWGWSTWFISIVAVEFGNQPRADCHLY